MAKKKSGTKVGNFLRSAVSTVKNVVSSAAKSITASALNAVGRSAIPGESYGKSTQVSSKQASQLNNPAYYNPSSGKPLNTLGGGGNITAAENSKYDYGMSYVPTSTNKSSGGGSSVYDYGMSYVPDGSSSILGASNLFSMSSAPTNAGNINSAGTGSINLPKNIMGRNDVNDAYAYTKGDQETLKNKDQYLSDYYSERLSDEQARQKEETSWLQDLMGQRTTREDEEARIREREDLMSWKQYQAEKAGVQTKINTLKDEYAKIEEQLNQQIATITNSEYGTMDFLNARTAAMERNAAPRLNRLAAQINLNAAELAAIDQNWEASEKFVNDAVDAIMAEQEQDLKLAFEFYDINKDMFDRIDKIYSDSYQEALQTKQADLDYQRDLYKMEYSQKMQQKYSTSKGSTDVQATTGFANSSIEGDVRGDAVALLNQNKTPQEVYNTLRKLYSSSEVSDVALKQLVGLVESPIQTTQETTKTKNKIQLPKIGSTSTGFIDVTPTIKSFFSNLFN